MGLLTIWSYFTIIHYKLMCTCHERRVKFKEVIHNRDISTLFRLYATTADHVNNCVFRVVHHLWKWIWFWLLTAVPVLAPAQWQPKGVLPICRYGQGAFLSWDDHYQLLLVKSNIPLLKYPIGLLSHYQSWILVLVQLFILLNNAVSVP